MTCAPEDVARSRGKTVMEVLPFRTGSTPAAPEEAAALLTNGESKYDKSVPPVELAAWTMVASSVLNLDETISKE